MLRRMAAAGAVLLLVGCGAGGPEVDQQSPPAQLAPVPETIPALKVTEQESLGERTTQYYVESDLVPLRDITGGRASVVVTLPRDFDPDLDYPVLYLLHGTDDSAVAWFEKGAVEAATDELDAIVVQPEGGETGWYMDWMVEEGGQRFWRSHHLDQVVPWVDETFGTVAEPGGRAIAGASAGGYGAISYAEQRPGTFGTAMSFSGVLSLEGTQMRQLAQSEFARATGNGDDVLGDGRSTSEEQWDDADPSLHVGTLRGTAVAVFRGSGDDYESQLGETTDLFVDRARENDIDITSFAYEDLFSDEEQMPNQWACTGLHDWSCWSGSLQHSVPWLQDEIGRPR